MDVEFVCIEGGQKLYAVRSFGQDLFTGTRDECRRFQDVRQSKLREERATELRPHRHAPFVARSYHVSKIHA
jgi:hypothetical protein